MNFASQVSLLRLRARRKVNKTHFILFLIVALGAFLRVFNLKGVPPGFANDEAAITYQAYSILLTGRDTWGKFLPLLSFKDFGEYLPPFAVYAQVPFLKFLGLSEFSARIPFALTGIMAIAVLYILTKSLFNKKWISLMACFLFAVSPFNIGWSRFVYEGNFGTLFYLLGITFFTLSLKKNIKLLPFSIAFFGLTLTTYHIYFFITPLTVILLYVPFIKKIIINKKILFISVTIGLIFILYGLLIVASGSGRERFRQVSIFSKSDIVNKLNYTQSYCSQKIPNSLCRLFFNKITAYTYEYSFNYLSHFSPTFLALNGSFLRQTILPVHGLIYPFELIFFYAGVVILIRKKDFSSYILISWLAIYPMANSFTGLGEISRIGHAMPLFPIVSALGLFTIVKSLKSYKYAAYVKAAILIVAIFNISGFLLNYFVVFPKTNSHFGSDAYVKLIKEIKTKNYPFQKFYVTRDYLGSAPEFQTRIFLPVNPKAFQDPMRNEIVIKEPEKYINYKRLDTFYFFSSLEEINPSKDDLVVKSESQLSPSDQILFEIRENNGDLSLIGVLGGNNLK